jgi:L-threonylcarbamoyladenylate synthase
MGDVLRLWLEHDPSLAVAAAARALAADGVVLFPTDTVYGLLALATSSRGYASIFRIKPRGRDKPLQLLAHPASTLARQGLAALLAHPQLAQEFGAGKLTLVAEPSALPGAPAAVLSLQPGAIGIRVPSYPALLLLLEVLAPPQLLWATSANVSGAAPCCDALQAADWLDSVDPAPDLAVLSRAVCPGSASSVVRLEAGAPRRLR